MGKEKNLEAQNRLKALEFATTYIQMPIELCGKMSRLDYCKQEAEKILDWAYGEEEKEVNPFSEFGEDAELLNEWSKKLEECFEISEEKMLVHFLNDILKRRWK